MAPLRFDTFPGITSSWTLKNNNVEAKATKSKMRIIHTGDLNIKKNSDSKTNKKILNFINEVKDSNADLLVVTGDIVASGLEEDYNEAVSIFNMASIEKVFIPGNRDFYNGGNVCWIGCDCNKSWLCADIYQA